MNYMIERTVRLLCSRDLRVLGRRRQVFVTAIVCGIAVGAVETAAQETAVQRAASASTQEAARANAGSSEPSQVVASALAAVQKAIREAGVANHVASPAQISGADAALGTSVDFAAIAEGVMAANFKRASVAQRARFVHVFRASLVRTITHILLPLGAQQVTLRPAEARATSADGASVVADAVGKDGQAHVLAFSLARAPTGDWRVRNLVLDGVNLGLTYRSQFATALAATENQTDLDAVISSWGETKRAEPGSS